LKYSKQDHKLKEESSYNQDKLVLW